MPNALKMNIIKENFEKEQYMPKLSNKTINKAKKLGKLKSMKNSECSKYCKELIVQKKVSSWRTCHLIICTHAKEARE